MNVSVVAARLGLGPEYAEWLRMLDDLGPPPGGLPAPFTQDLAALGIQPEDRTDILRSLELPKEWRWLIERAFHAILTDIGDFEGTRLMPILPKDLGLHARCFWIAVFLHAVQDIRHWHKSHAIPNHISWDTLADLGRHIKLYRQRNGHTGLDTHLWMSLHFRGALFALGRLQYQMYHLKTGPAGPLFWYDDSTEPGLRRGDPALSLHIPESGPLTPAACAESFAQARAFFARHFPEYADGVATCTSWLLDDQLLEYLEPDSNIVIFQRRFHLVPGWHESDSSAFHFVFGSTPDRIDQLTPRTTLERAIAEHVRRGRHWGMRTGWLDLADQH
jgi:GNAT domain-containint protein/N-acyltransferase family protein